MFRNIGVSVHKYFMFSTPMDIALAHIVLVLSVCGSLKIFFGCGWFSSDEGQCSPDLRGASCGTHDFLPFFSILVCGIHQRIFFGFVVVVGEDGNSRGERLKRIFFGLPRSFWSDGEFSLNLHFLSYCSSTVCFFKFNIVGFSKFAAESLRTPLV